ncbi:MAG TPA: bifunctional hydroxymethylpyrimidine kinase/phosphomethylpyrimidine kinase [Macromonas sp.]|nr:bifunctional hydroxymethylpyrimidine kinase/phosphomethylpyrimidine kinase [Macromonas sp.]
MNDQTALHSLRYPRVLTIAGSDSGGGAGIQADLKTFSALGCYGMTAITALTAQNTQGVRAIHGVPAAFLKEQIAAVVEDIGVDAVKIGMLHAPEIVEAVAWAIDTYRLKRVVLDPVMVATSGDALIENATIAVLVRELFPRCTVVTPNLDEAGLLLGRTVREEAELEQACSDLLAMGAQAVLLKGGHLGGDLLTDVLAIRSEPATYWQHLTGERIASHNVHGTGCTMSSAIAAYLAQGSTLEEAVQAAHGYIRGAIAAGAAVSTGQGNGPLNHGYDPLPMKLMPADA